MNRTTKTLLAALVAVAGAVALRRRCAAVCGEESRGVLDPDGVTKLYGGVAPFYDMLTAPYRWIGAGRIADQAIDQLQLRPSDTVVDLGTGTGRNLVALANAVGPGATLSELTFPPKSPTS